MSSPHSKSRGGVVSSVTGSLDSVSFIHCQYGVGRESSSPSAKASAKHISPINQHLGGGKIPTSSQQTAVSFKTSNGGFL